MEPKFEPASLTLNKFDDSKWYKKLDGLPSV